MRLVTLFAAFCFFNSALAGDTGTAGRYPDAPVTMELKRVSEHVYFVQGAAGVATDNAGFISNAGAVITGEGVVVFDALGTPSLAKRLLEEIRRKTIPGPARRKASGHRPNVPRQQVKR